MAEKGVNACLVFAVTLAAVSAASLFIWPLGLMLCLMNVFAFGVEMLILRFTRPVILKRKIPLDKWWDKFLTPLVALAAIASAVLSVYDVISMRITVLPAWCFFLGVVLLLSAYVILAQSLKSNAPHGREKYGEEPAEGGERGPYDVIRHPVMLAVLLGGIAMPLVIGSGIGFAPVGLLLAALIIRVAVEDDWRFNNYEWFYDYTKEVSYRLIPFIW